MLLSLTSQTPVAGEETGENHALDDLAGELKALQSSVRRLEETLQKFMDSAMAEMRKENRLLREELRRLEAYPGARLYRDDAPDSPSDTESSPRVDQRIGFMDELSSGEGPDAAKKFEYIIVKEWDRTRERAERLGRNAPTLKGMICVVTESSTREELEELARRLRARFDDYDNINIEVFNNLETAQRYANQQRRRPQPPGPQHFEAQSLGSRHCTAYPGRRHSGNPHNHREIIEALIRIAFLIVTSGRVYPPSEKEKIPYPQVTDRGPFGESRRLSYFVVSEATPYP